VPVTAPLPETVAASASAAESVPARVAAANAPVEPASAVFGEPASQPAAEQAVVSASEPVHKPATPATTEPAPAAGIEPVSTSAVAAQVAQMTPVESAIEAQQGKVARPASQAASAKAANGLSSADLQSLLDSAGLVWVNTDVEKLRVAQEVAARTPPPAHAARERKPLPPTDTTPMQQIETRKAE
jgi:ribonuclease E